MALSCPSWPSRSPTIENGGLSEDLLSITWTLKEGLLWSDGSDVTAADVVFTWQYCSNEATGCTASEAFLGIESVEALDDRTIKITFDSPTPYPYNAFVGSGTPIISSVQFADCVGEAAQTCNEQNTAPLGTGPYRIIDFKVNDVAVFERNPHYHGERAHFDKVIFKGGGDAASAARAVLENRRGRLRLEPTGGAGHPARNGSGGTGPGSSPPLPTESSAFWSTRPIRDPDLGRRAAPSTWAATISHPFLSFPPIPQAMSMAIDRVVSSPSSFTGSPARRPAT